MSTVIPAQQRSPDVTFQLSVVQADQAVRDGLAVRKKLKPATAGTRGDAKVTEQRETARREFDDSSAVRVHVFEEGFAPRTLIATQQKARAEDGTQKGARILGLPVLEADYGREVHYLVGKRAPIPTMPDEGFLSSLPAGVSPGVPSLPARDFGLTIGLRALELPDGRVRVSVRARTLGVDFSESQMQQGHFVPRLTVGGGDFQVLLAKGQSFALTGLIADRLLDSLDQVNGIKSNRLFAEIQSAHRQKDGSNLVILVTPQFASRQPDTRTERQAPEPL